MPGVTVSAGPTLLRILRWCHHWNAAHPWDHNAHYHRWVLRRLPMSVDSTLDVGCGTGDLARSLRARSRLVHGVDLDERSVATAQRLTPGSSGISFSVGDLMDLPRSRQYDVITAVAVLHHVPLAPALRRLRDALTPGGTLVVLGCYREATLSDWVLSSLAVPANVLMGAVQAVRRGRRQGRPLSMTAPTAPATTTLADIRCVAACELPSAAIRRHLFWRYSLIFHAPRP